MSLTDVQQKFVSAWGQMGSAWGISRTQAEVHALLYITGEPLCTDDVMENLQISRGNASMSLRALLDWGVVSRTHKRGDRKEYFVAEQDVWTMFRSIVRQRLKREVDPLLAFLYEIRDMRPSDPEHTARLDALLEFFNMVETLGQRFAGPTGMGLEHAARMLDE
ncbi:MAG: ArsR family transcriptional regulator [Phycisphaerales bacterium]|nr:ArsR family transcriptional regulator [Phycisphaerales bacterium]